VIAYSFYTTEGVPLGGHGNVRESGLVPFIDKYGIWAMCAPGVLEGERVCYIGARFDNVKETSMGRLNRVVLLMAFRDGEKVRNAWKLFSEDAIRKFAEESGLIFDEEFRVSENVESLHGDVPDEALEQLYGSVVDYMRTLQGVDSIAKVPFRRVEVEGLTNVEYPSLYHRKVALAGILEATYSVSGDSCMPNGFDKLLMDVGDDLVYPLVIYSKASGPNWGALWFSRR